MAGFEVSTFDLSMRSPETGAVLQANIYRVDGIARDLSIGQLVMAICLEKATGYEDQIIAKMGDMATTTTSLEQLTTVQEALVAAKSLDNLNITVINSDGDEVVITNLASLNSFLRDAEVIETDYASDVDYETVISDISSKMDSLNSVNQKEMIELQALTNKRDQNYDLITNVLKSLNTVLVGVANNM